MDFWYGEYEYHLDGGEEMMVSQLLKELGIEDIAIKDVVNVTFSDESLVKVEKVNKLIWADDWKLTSLKAFDSEEKLTIECADKVIEIKVTDLHGDNIIPVTTKVPLKKTVTSNESKAVTLEGLDEIDIEYNIDYINKTHGNAKEGLTIDPENYSLSAETVVSEGTESGNSWTYTQEGDNSPWTLTFTQEGTYEVTITENTSNLPEWVTGDSASITLTYVVVQEENKLRIAETYKGPEHEASATTTTPVQGNISIDQLFYTSKDIGNIRHGAVDFSQSGSKINMSIWNDDGERTIGAITTEFGFDFSRSFTISGKMQMVTEDGMAMAFQTKQKVETIVRESSYGLDDTTWSQGNAGYDEMETYFRLGSDPDGSDNQTRFVKRSNLGNGFLFIMQNEPLSGYASFIMDGLKRTPYNASSGLANGNYQIYSTGAGSGRRQNLHHTSEQNYLVSFECNDHDTGSGKLTITVIGDDVNNTPSKTVVYNNFVASEVFGQNNWHNAYFVLGACADNHSTGSISIDRFEYEDGIGAATTSFWADRDLDGQYETQVNLTDSYAVPGETILVRHDLTPSDSAGYDHTFYIKTWITQLKAGNTALSGRDAICRTADGTVTESVRNATSAAYNTYTLSDGMFVPVIQGSQHTYFEYKITAPETNDTKVYESALFGEPPFPSIKTDTYGFRTEKALSWETPAFTDNVTLRTVTYNPNGGAFSDNTTANKIVKYGNGATCTVISPAPTKEDYIFKGWKLNDTTSYQPGDTFKVTADVTLTAQWEKACTIIIRCDKNNTLIKTASFILRDSNGTELWSGAADTSTGKVSIPWAQIDTNGDAAFKPGTIYTLIQTATDSTHLTPTGKWTLTVDNDYKITATGVEEGDTQHQWMVTRTSVENDSLVIYNMPFTTLTIVNNMDEDVDVSALKLNPNMTDPGSSIASLNNVYFVQETTDAGTTTVTYTPVNGAVPSKIVSGEIVKLMFSGNARDYYQIEGGIDTMFKVDLHLSDVGQHFELTDTPITGSASRVTGTVDAFIAKGSMSGAAGATVTFGDVISTPAAYIRIQNQTQQKLTFRLFVGENGAYHQHIIKKGSSNQHPIDPVHTDHDGYYYEFTMDAATANKSETLMLPSAGGLVYNIKVYKEIDGTLTDITDSLASNRVKLNDEPGKVSDPVTGTLKEGPTYTGREIFDTVLADRTKFTNVCYVVLPTVPLTITKQVTGAMGDTSAANEFTFTISVAGASATEEFSFTKGEATGSITNGGTFKLAHGQNIVIEVPPAKDVTIQETNGYYAATFAATKTGGGTAEIKSTTANSATLNLSDATTLAVTNTLGEIAPTGVSPTSLAFLLILLAGLAIAAGTLMLRRKRTRV